MKTSNLQSLLKFNAFYISFLEQQRAGFKATAKAMGKQTAENKEIKARLYKSADLLRSKIIKHGSIQKDIKNEIQYNAEWIKTYYER